MVKHSARGRRSSVHYLALLVLTTTLAACGGGGDTEADDPLDADDDGIPDIEDPFVDLDGDGFDDPDFDLDGIRDSVDTDADGDGEEDFLDSFVDLDGDGLDDRDGEPEQMVFVPTPVSAQNPCGGEPGSDGVSVNSEWDDNCWVRVNDNAGEGQFANSLYTVGIQRIVYCAGFGEGASYEEFADGLFGPMTEAALREYQTSLSLVADGEVGPSTWAALRGSISLLVPGDLDANDTALEAYGFDAGRCADIPLFYQTVTPIPDSVLVQEGGWQLAKNRPNTSETAPFSINADVTAVD